MAPIRIVYLVLFIVGTILPWYYFATWFNEFGWNLSAMVDAWNVNDAATGLVYDLTVSYTALLIWIVYETFKSGRWLNLIAIPVSTAIGVSAGLPLYLFLRSRP